MHWSKSYHVRAHSSGDSVFGHCGKCQPAEVLHAHQDDQSSLAPTINSRAQRPDVYLSPHTDYASRRHRPCPAKPLHWRAKRKNHRKQTLCNSSSNITNAHTLALYEHGAAELQAHTTRVHPHVNIAVPFVGKPEHDVVVVDHEGHAAWQAPSGHWDWEIIAAALR